MLNIADLLKNREVEVQENDYKSWRDQMIKETVIAVNNLRKGTKYEKKVETPANLDKRINMNKFLAGKKNDYVLDNLIKECKRQGSYALLYWYLRQK